jgi:hypothetical protein
MWFVPDTTTGKRILQSRNPREENSQPIIVHWFFFFWEEKSFYMRAVRYTF